MILLAQNAQFLGHGKSHSRNMKTSPLIFALNREEETFENVTKWSSTWCYEVVPQFEKPKPTYKNRNGGGRKRW